MLLGGSPGVASAKLVILDGGVVIIGALLIDIAIDRRGWVETSRPTTYLVDDPGPRDLNTHAGTLIPRRGGRRSCPDPRSTP